MDIVSGRKCGRENDKEYICFDAVGLSYIDIMLAYTMFKKCEAAGVSTMLPMQVVQIFEHDMTGKLML